MTMKPIAALTILLSLLWAVALTSCSSHKQSIASRPQYDQIQAVLDSICNEGYNLFVADRVNWVASDSAVEHCGMERIGGNIIWQPTDSTWRAVFLDKEQENCIFELNYNVNRNEHAITYITRPINETERKQQQLKSTMWANVMERYGDSLHYYSDYGRPNFDLVRIGANTLRLYVLQGVERPNIIPFGNDVSIDFDNNGNVKAFRRYHKSFIPIPTVDEEGNGTTTNYHSHLKDNPYITPTDICNFLLYRGELQQTNVLSTALNGVIIYDASNNKACFLSLKALKKITKHQHRH